MTYNGPSRYENALAYGPGRSVGFYPDQGWGNGFTPAGAYPVTPATFAPVAPTEAMATGGSGYGALPLASVAGLGLTGLAKYLTSSPTPSPGSTGNPEPMYGDPNAVMNGVPSSNISVDPIYGDPNAVSSGVSAAGDTPSLLSRGYDALSGLGGSAVNFGAGMLGSWAGGRLAADIAPGDAEQQPIASSIGGTLGGIGGGLAAGAASGAAAGSIVPGIGTLIGAFVGALAAGSLGGGSPDIPYGWSPATFGNGGLNLGAAAAGNHANPGIAGNIGQDVARYLSDRAQAEGLQFDPFYTGEGYNAGFYNGNLTYQRAGLGGAPPASNEYQWQGNNIGDLEQFAYGDLTSRGILTATPQITQQQYLDDQWRQWNAYNQGMDAFNTAPGINFGNDDGSSNWTGNAPPSMPGGYFPSWLDSYNAQFVHAPFEEMMTGDGSGGGPGDSGPASGGPPGTSDNAGPPGVAAAAPSVDSVASIGDASANAGVAAAPPGDAPSTGVPGDPGPPGDPGAPGDAGDAGDGGVDGGTYRAGGRIPGPTNPPQPVEVQAHTGEFVIRPEMVTKYGTDFLRRINNGTYPMKGRR